MNVRFFVVLLAQVICVHAYPMHGQPVVMAAQEALATAVPLTQQLGNQLIIELCDCNPELINNMNHVQETMLAAARAAKATIITQDFHQFSPQGISGVVIIAESHLAIHTWPEFGYCAIDVFTCGTLDNAAAIAVLKDGFQSKKSTIVQVKRGIPESCA